MTSAYISNPKQRTYINPLFGNGLRVLTKSLTGYGCDLIHS